ncbi:MAG: efflux RND transporter periplasmic adaptor subunit [Selenomonas sp.]|jgi:membrane fusion protein (multidrug efflux system)|nr:efflux RND transporter periplasmic adaptor subunit [Selenomonas sp.]MBQ2088285.1 efflux RND transporter periplasmic adaptor subunit [Selenomonas sp.]MBQ4212481.1 efflux RND transporter periplasmic adaptor subunit [Selenomonas sp.]MBQ5501309.1 efflux RND transporter periplasmic adaptor subunit [Selenomonas sp.]
MDKKEVHKLFLPKNKKTRALLIGVSLAVATSFVVVGCGADKQQAAQMQGAQVKAMQVIQQDTPLTSEFAGQIVGKDEVKVQSKVSGNVVEKYVKGGQWVEAGQPLYRIDDRQYQSAVWQAQANLAQAMATLGNAQNDLGRYADLVKASAISRQTYDTQASTVNAYQAAADAANALYIKARQDLADTTIYAPMSGQLAVDDVAVGTFVTAGNTNLVTIGSSNPVYAKFNISETDYLSYMGALMQGGNQVKPIVTITMSDGTQYPLEGEIVESDRALSENTGTLTVKALFNNPNGLLMPGMFARVRLSGQTIPNAILVPQRAVQQLLGKSFVMVVNGDGKSEARNVTLGSKVGSYYVIKDGLTTADVVVVEGLSNLQEGVALNVTMVTADDMGFSLITDMSKFNSNAIAGSSNK